VSHSAISSESTGPLVSDQLRNIQKKVEERFLSPEFRKSERGISNLEQDAVARPSVTPRKKTESMIHDL
jgi:hypothetical protein